MLFIFWYKTSESYFTYKEFDCLTYFIRMRRHYQRNILEKWSFCSSKLDWLFFPLLFYTLIHNHNSFVGICQPHQSSQFRGWTSYINIDSESLNNAWCSLNKIDLAAVYSSFWNSCVAGIILTLHAVVSSPENTHRSEGQMKDFL